MILFTLEIQIANSALDVHLSDLEKHQEWKDYIERKKPVVSLHQKHLATNRHHNLGFLVQLSSRPLCSALASRDR